jgi:hypothetical protein
LLSQGTKFPIAHIPSGLAEAVELKPHFVIFDPALRIEKRVGGRVSTCGGVGAL